ncbi:hypothetical protein ACHAW5_008920 [Stephanodiscus triporus]|uniref:Acyltransferase n=1 Tax=Stephanodiscus triporus TaxID=2934178 RepID=A0ABD3MKP8_9STRA
MTTTGDACESPSTEKEGGGSGSGVVGTARGGGDRSKWKIADTPQDAGILPTVGVTLWLGWNGFLLYTIPYAIFLAGKWQRAVILGFAILSLALPANFPGALGYRMGDWMMSQAEKYFGLKTVIEDEDDLIRHSERNKSLIFAFNPHDVLPYSVFCFNPSLRRLPGKIGKDGCALMTSAVFGIPFIRHVYSWVRCLPVDKRTFLRRLHDGQSFAFSPGGVQEVLLLNPAKPHELVLYLKQRKGFIKLALTTGSPVVPVFAFNLDGSYGYWLPRGPFVEKISRAVGIAPLVFWGRWGIPFGIPHPRKSHVVIGRAIDMPKNTEGENVTQELVDEWHAVFLEELELLFERHKNEAGHFADDDVILNDVLVISLSSHTTYALQNKAWS